MKNIILFLILFFIAYNSFSQEIRIEGCSKTIKIKSGKKFICLKIKSLIIFNMIKDSLKIDYFSETNKLKIFNSNTNNIFYSKHNIDTNNLGIELITNKLIIYNDIIIKKKNPIIYIDAKKVTRIIFKDVFSSIKQYGFWKGRNGAIIIETKKE